MVFIFNEPHRFGIANLYKLRSRLLLHTGEIYRSYVYAAEKKIKGNRNRKEGGEISQRVLYLISICVRDEAAVATTASEILVRADGEQSEFQG